MADLAERQSALVTNLLTRFRDLVAIATEPVNSTATPAQAAFNSMSMDNLSRNMIKLVEDMLQVTRQIRELWIVGPLRVVGGEGDTEDRENMDQTVNEVLQQLNTLRDRARQQMVADSNGVLEYVSGPISGSANSEFGQPGGAPAG